MSEEPLEFEADEDEAQTTRTDRGQLVMVKGKVSMEEENGGDEYDCERREKGRETEKQRKSYSKHNNSRFFTLIYTHSH